MCGLQTLLAQALWHHRSCGGYLKSKSSALRFVIFIEAAGLIELLLLALSMNAHEDPTVERSSLL